NEFVLDDYPIIVENDSIKELDNLSKISDWSLLTNKREVILLTFAVNYYFHGFELFGYHLVNLVIHILNGILVYFFVILLFNTSVGKSFKFSNNFKLIALLCSILFITHPLQTQAVTYIVQRTTSLVALFYLSSIMLYVYTRQSWIKNGFRTSTVILFLLLLFSFLLGFFTKATIVTLPIILLLIELFFIRGADGNPDRKFLITASSFIFLTIIFAFIFVGLPKETELLSPADYLLTQFKVIPIYLKLFVLPISQSIDYDIKISNSLFELDVFFGFLLLLCLFIIAIFTYKKYRLISFGIFWFFITLSVESSIIPIRDVIFEHRMYLPSFGLIISIISAIFYFLKLNQLKSAVIIIFGISLLLGYLTFKRNYVWRDGITIWTDTIQKFPQKARCYNERGLVYSRIGNYKKALNDFTTAVRLKPDYLIPLVNRGTAYSKIGKDENAISDFSEALKLNPKDMGALRNRYFLYKKIGEEELAQKDLEVLLSSTRDPKLKALLRGETENFEKGVRRLNQLIAQNPRNYDYHYQLGILFSQNRMFEQAIQNFSKVIELNPEHINSYVARGNAYFSAQKYSQAINDYSNVLRNQVNNATIYYNRGVSYFYLNDKNRAWEDIQKAINLGYFVPQETIDQIKPQE
ncbi:tetratricopeptide repeat protein, partial [Bacteroidota bacterium]